jgi:hypothetical protein
MRQPETVNNNRKHICHHFVGWGAARAGLAATAAAAGRRLAQAAEGGTMRLDGTIRGVHAGSEVAVYRRLRQDKNPPNPTTTTMN